MRICIPTTDNKGQDSQLCDHFGSAPFFIIYDSETSGCESVDNLGRDHEHGQCHPMENLNQKGIDVVICKGLGKRALLGLENSGIKVLRVQGRTVKEAVENLSAGRLEPIHPEDACQDHSCH